MPLFLFSDITANLHVFYAENGFKNGPISEKRRNFCNAAKMAIFLKILQRPWQGRIVKIGRFSVRMLDGEKGKKNNPYRAFIFYSDFTTILDLLYAKKGLKCPNIREESKF